MWTAEMPSNIAVIKYMGKKPQGKNRPTNPSLSWTLPHLTTRVEVAEASDMSWEPLNCDYPIELSSRGRQRYLAHAEFVLDQIGSSKKLKIRSGNNFPSDCGIASSASSFAALTEVLTETFAKEKSDRERAWISAQGSGSSCRSFMPGWVRWDGDNIDSLDAPFGNLKHMVVIASAKLKKVSSSEAHRRVVTSSLFAGRTERAEARLNSFVQALANSDWLSLCEIAWSEFWDMHALFETSQPSFGYFTGETIDILNSLREFDFSQGQGPIVTMDAGPNVHLLWRNDQTNNAKAFFTSEVRGKYSCFSDIEGIGIAKL